MIFRTALAAFLTSGAIHCPAAGCRGSIGSEASAAERTAKRYPDFALNPRLHLHPEKRRIPEGEFQTPFGNKTAVRHASDPWSGKDKAQHFVVSFLATGAVSYSAYHRWNCGRSQSVKWGLGLTLSLGICKEIRDLFHPDARASLRDIAADLFGAACGALLVSWW